MIDRNVPNLTSGWLGTGTVTVVSDVRFCITMWLPRCRTCANPFSARIWQTSRPDRTRSLPNGYLELGYVYLLMKSIPDLRRIGGLEEQLQGFNQVGAGLTDGVALTRNVQFWAERHVPVVLAFNDRRELMGSLHKFTDLSG